MSRRNLTWLIVALAVLAAAALGWRGLRARQAAQQSQSAPAAAPVIELRALDVAPVDLRELAVSLPISGSLRAVRSAFVKARVPGELLGLTVREGDRVQAGQVIARVESTEYDERMRQAYTAILFNWLREMLFGAEQAAGAMAGQDVQGAGGG